MKEQLISFETAKLAKEVGFNLLISVMYYDVEEVISPGYSSNVKDYDDKYPAPTQSLLQKWLRGKFKVFIYIDETGRPHIKSKDGVTLVEVCVNGKYSGFQFEEALEKGLFEALTYLKNGNSNR